MAKEKDFYNRLISAWDDYRELSRSKEYWENLADERRHEIGQLHGALKRAQEVIDGLAEALPDGELKQDAKVYANVIAGVVGEWPGKPFPHYSENPLLKDYLERAKNDRP